MKKTIALILTALLLIGSMTACTAGGADKPQDAAQEGAKPGGGQLAAQTEATPADTPEPTIDPTTYAGELTLYTCHIGSRYNEALLLFTATYPNIGINVVIGDGASLLSRMEREACDVIWGVPTALLSENAHLLQPYETTDAAMLLPEYQDAAHTWTAESIERTAFLYNKSLVSEAATPNDLAALTSGDWKAKVALGDPNACDAGWLFLAAASRAQNADLSALKRNLIVTPDEIDALQGVAAGKYAFAATSESAARARAAENDALGALMLDDCAVVYCSGVAMSASCKNETLAKLLIDFLISEPCQSAMAERFLCRSVRADVNAAALPQIDAATTQDVSREAALAAWETIAADVRTAS